LGESAICAILPHMRFLWLTLLLIISPAYAWPEQLNIAFEEGQYREAATIAQAEENADSLAFAARCLLAEAMSAPDHQPPQTIVVEAEQLARQALEREPNHIEGRLQLAIALSLRAHPLTTREAMRAGYGGDAKELVESVLEDDPDNFYANGFMAVWNVEVVRHGGSVGSAILGASVKKGRRFYSAAAEIAADDAPTHWQYARALAALNAKKYRSEIEMALTAALTADAGTALEQVMQDRAQILKTALETQDRKAVQALAAGML